MNELQQTKDLVAIAPGAIKDDAAFTSLVIDRNDFPGASYIEFKGTLGSIDAAMAQLRVMESDVKTDATTLGGAPTLVKDSTTKPGANDDNKTFVFGIDLSKQRQRYFQLQATAGNGAAETYLSATAVGYRMGEAGSSASRLGLLFAEYA